MKSPLMNSRYIFIVVFFFIFIMLLLVPSSSQGFQKMKKGAKRFHSIIVQVAGYYKVEADLIKAIIMAESGFDPNAVSRKGARGLMQLMPATAEALGVEDPMDPEQNIDGGVRYFKDLKKQFGGNIILTLAAYHAGISKVKRCGGVPQSEETRRYIRRVLQYYITYKDAENTEAYHEPATQPNYFASREENFYPAGKDSGLNVPQHLNGQAF
jgi:hypothetical protein